ncbi:MAG: ABC transporter permease [Spirochaetes bacterium]|nr:ABC transporter permease [Spirochaetota bacterium]
MLDFDLNVVKERKEKLYGKIKKETDKHLRKIVNYQKKERKETSFTLFIRKFKKHKLAVIFFWILMFFYFCMFLSGFIAPYSAQYKFKRNSYNIPTRIHFFDERGKFIGPYVFKYKMINPIFKSYSREVEDVVFYKNKQINIYVKYKISFFVKAEPYKLFWFIPTDIHLFGVKGSYDSKTGEHQYPIFLFGADGLGRDIFSRILHGSWVSLTVGFLGTFISLIIALILGGIAGYLGGKIDWLIMRFCEILLLFPGFYFLLFLRSLIPVSIPPAQSYILIVTILAIISFGGLTRIVRGFFLSFKNEDYVLAAQAQGISQSRIIFKHIVPQLSSYLIVSVSMSIPGYILGETGLSFLGLGITEPSVSWGLLLSESNNVSNVFYYPWILIPSIFIILTTMSFNMIGDGLRDALDPRTKI